MKSFEDFQKNLLYPRGRLIGGSGSINAMIWNKGNLNLFDLWEKNHGTVGWNKAEAAKYFEKIEKVM